MSFKNKLKLVTVIIGLCVVEGVAYAGSCYSEAYGGTHCGDGINSSSEDNDYYKKNNNGVFPGSTSDSYHYGDTSSSWSTGYGGYRNSNGTTSPPDGFGSYRNSDGSSCQKDGFGGYRCY